MTAAAVEVSEAETATGLRARAVDAVRRVAHVGQEARHLTSMATDAVDEGVYAVKRAVRRTHRGVEDLSDEALHRLKREPVKALGLALGVGILLGAAFGWMWRRCAPARQG